VNATVDCAASRLLDSTLPHRIADISTNPYYGFGVPFSTTKSWSSMTGSAENKTQSLYFPGGDLTSSLGRAGVNTQGWYSIEFSAETTHCGTLKADPVSMSASCPPPPKVETFGIAPSNVNDGNAAQVTVSSTARAGFVYPPSALEQQGVAEVLLGVAAVRYSAQVGTGAESRPFVGGVKGLSPVKVLS
jgi:hypothetical protein